MPGARVRLGTRADAARVRAGETKRERSRQRLIAAATDLFTERGWYGTRVEDIAEAAAVSTATAYNHFANKFDLLAAAYAPLLQGPIDQAQADVAAQLPSEETLRRATHALAAVARGHREMTIALVAAIPEIYARLGPPRRPDDPRLQVQYEKPLIVAMADGQRRGTMSRDVDAIDLALATVAALVMRVQVVRRESATETADLLLRMLIPALRV